MANPVQQSLFNQEKHLMRCENALTAFGIIFTTATLVGIVALMVFSFNVFVVPALAFTITLLSVGGTALATLITWIAICGIGGKIKQKQIEIQRASL